MQAFDRDAPLPEERLSLLFEFGAPSQKITIDEMPADMQVCNCNGVTKAALGACVAAGNRTTKAAMDATRAGNGCGSCKNLVAEVVQTSRRARVMTPVPAASSRTLHGRSVETRRAKSAA
jgi:nitrite reductase [NAD(P)H] large subunit